MSIRTYAVNCNDAWLNTEGDDISGSYVKYKDHQEVVAALEAKCAALAVENELARKAVQAFCDVVGDNTEVIAEVVGRDGVLVILKAMKATGNMSATDAFLSEVRAQGVEMFAQWCRGERDFTLIDEDVADAAAYEECVKRAEYFAAQLRKGGKQ
ncbi:hypothetical protein [Escherichia coli]|uniref:hypothetical protein n=1 Tax=Escherichia coli TaxID=562 RepID=UPI000416B504|nr:hypothetical protein [Escherichia coli]MCM5208601.1 hypothetical protein [Escherichia coli]MEC6583950.1 hypothetical protein [Escherichia coli]MEC6682623.1 hypothetical protein [Escherichia coli]UGF32153.1 hypothetical protein LQQ80_25635 [Escherichia coli]UWC54997.1 hypothetical protein M5R25_26380 [Escherichia coli]